MSITGELREYTKHYSVAGSKKDTMLSSIADRIDAEHQKAIREMNNLADTSMLLPVDANGETIHVGDEMAMATFKCEFPRRQAMLTIREPHHKGNGIIEYDEVARVPVFVWPNPTVEGLFIVEHQDGTAQRVQPDSLTFLGSKELFDQYDWSES